MNLHQNLTVEDLTWSHPGKNLKLLRLMSGIVVESRGCNGFGVFDKAVSSWIDNVSEEHGLTEDSKTVAPFSRISVP